jgi:hypothetical protein
MIQRLSEARLVKYIETASGSYDDALRLYEWNLQISGELFKVLSFVEVILRNSLASNFARNHKKHGGDGNWLMSGPVIKFPRQIESIERAKSQLMARGAMPTLDCLIPELSFGFWRYLLTKRYADAYWPTVLSAAFPHVHSGDRRTLFERVGRLHRLRNRIAHHEPIFGRRLDLDHRDCLLVLGAICPVTARWVESQSRVPEVLAVRPPL